jgi:hypothetical protein
MSLPTPIDFKILDVLCTLIKDQMDLPDTSVWIYNQKRMIPHDPGLYVEVALRSMRPFGSNSQHQDDDAGNFTEYQFVNVQETYGITLYSRDESAITRAYEVVMALSGVLSQQLQETYSFHLGPIPPEFKDTSEVEASARLFRQELIFNAIRSYTKTRVISYFDKFSIPPTIITNQ